MQVPANPESVFTYGAPALKFGPGASDEIGFDLSQYDVRRVLVITDPGVAVTGHPHRVADQMSQFGIESRVFDRTHVEPTDASLEEAIGFARDNGPWDAFVAVGGGSAIDTAKAVNLMTSNPGELMDYVNAPVGKGRAPINALRPTLAVVDPRLTNTQPAGVTAACGMGILCHALESWTARPYQSYEQKLPDQRVPYCGANPIAGRVRNFHPEGYPPDEPMVPHGMAVSLTAPEAFRSTFDACPERHLRAAAAVGDSAT